MIKLTEKQLDDLIDEFKKTLDNQVSKLCKAQSLSYKSELKITYDTDEKEIDEIKIKIKRQ